MSGGGFASLAHFAEHVAHMAEKLVEHEAHGAGHGGGGGGEGASAHDILAEGCKIVEREIARGLSGKNVFGLAPLSAATIARKGSTLYLRETGALAGSLRTSVGDHEARVGSNDPKVAFLEFGTSKMPPRSTFLSAAKIAEPRVHAMAKARIMAAFRS